jgi:hypothetical protein
MSLFVLMKETSTGKSHYIVLVKINIHHSLQINFIQKINTTLQQILALVVVEVSRT